MGFSGLVRVGACAVALASVGSPILRASAPPVHPAKAAPPLSAWEQASKVRAAFEQQAAGTRTKAGYARVLDGFRAIYHANPRDAHAPDAINAVAEVLAEQGRELDDVQSLKAAIGQYEFLRTQYPASALREPALLAEARIERDDLGDGGVAKAKFGEVVKESPRSEAAAEARRELAAPTHHDEAVMSGARKSVGPVTESLPQRLKPAPVAKLDDTAEAAPLQNAGVNYSAVRTADSSAALRNDKQELRNDKQELRNDKQELRNDKQELRNDKTLAQVTGIRHWSTATYTRVAIDLGDEVKFEAARVPNPDRIYFDLHGAKLAQELVGKSFDVTDDGFLKRIRAAQAGGDVTRVVLDVSDVAEYSAFLLPNPYRLIIDIHGAKNREEGRGIREEKTQPEVPAAVAKSASAAANVSGLPAMSPTDGGDTVRPVVAVAMTPESHVPESRQDARQDTRHGAPNLSAVPTVKPVPNTVAVMKPATTSEVAAVSLSPGRVEATSAPTSKPIVAKSRDEGRGKREENTADAGPGKAAARTADGQTSLIRALGLKINRIVIDAGHGGHDSGTLGVDGIQEKDVVLDVALRVGKMLHDRLGAEIIYTRSDDTFIPLETRTAIANKAQADLFLSIHANSSPDASARGVEVYYLNFTSDPTALDVAARENAVAGESIHQLSDLVKKIALKDKIAESREFAADVEGSLFAGLTKGGLSQNGGLRDRGVKKAPFVVLIGANMPSILAEISFVTNATDAAQLREPEYRQRVAESLYNGVAKYEGGLAGAKAASPAVKRASLQ